MWVKTPTIKEAMVTENASPRSVIVIQIDRGTQRRNCDQLRRRSENQTSAQTTMAKVSSTLPKQKLETGDEAIRYEEPAEESATTTVHQPAEGPGKLPPDNIPVEQTGRKTVHKIRTESTSTSNTCSVKELYTRLTVDVEFCLIVKV